MCEYVVKIEWHMHILSPVIKFNNADKFSKNMLGHWHKAVIKFADSQQDNVNGSTSTCCNVLQTVFVDANTVKTRQVEQTA